MHSNNGETYKREKISLATYFISFTAYHAFYLCPDFPIDVISFQTGDWTCERIGFSSCPIGLFVRLVLAFAHYLDRSFVWTYGKWKFHSKNQCGGLTVYKSSLFWEWKWFRSVMWKWGLGMFASRSLDNILETSKAHNPYYRATVFILKITPVCLWSVSSFPRLAWSYFVYIFFSLATPDSQIKNMWRCFRFTGLSKKKCKRWLNGRGW